MKLTFACTTALLASLFITATARADCTKNPFRMGYDAAQQACADIAQSYVPSGRYFTTPDREKSCSIDDVIDCKNAFGQYLREHKKCAKLIDDNVSLYDEDGREAGKSKELWRKYVTRTCNQ